MSSPRPSRIVFGLVVPSTRSGLGERIDAITSRMSEQMGVPIERRDAASYEALATDVREGRVDFAWLPLIVFMRLGDAVKALGSVMRGDTAGYEAALVVRADSKLQSIDALRGT